MELTHYLRILRRSWPLVIGLPVLVALLTLALALLLPESYKITAAVLVTQHSTAANAPQNILPDQNNWNSWAASEYVVDDIPQIVETRRFADDVAAWIQRQHGVRVDPEDIQEQLTAERTHRMIYLTAIASRADVARHIVEGGAAMLQQKGIEYWNRQDSTALEVSQLDLPEEAEPARGLLRLAVDLVLRTLLALILGIGLAFLRHYLDSSLHRRGEVEDLGLEVVGMIPLDGLQRPQP